MQKYNEKLVEQVRSRKAQFRVDCDSKWSDLVNYIRNDGRDCKITSTAKFVCYVPEDTTYGGYWEFVEPVEGLPILHAKDFLVQEPEVNWVEARNNSNQPWSRAILIADIGTQFKFRYIVVEPGKENRFIGGESNLDVSAFKYMREIPQPEPLTHSELEKLIGKPFKYVEE